MSLERIIRPFQQNDVFTAKVLPPIQPNVASTADVSVTWGQGTSLLAKAIGTKNFRFGVLDELDRKTSTVRVTNPDDAAQYVDVKRIDYLKMQDEDGLIHEFNFNNT